MSKMKEMEIEASDLVMLLRRYYERNTELVKARASARPDEEKKRHKSAHKSNNPEYYKALVSVRKRRHRSATPPWITKEQKLEMRKLYLNGQKAPPPAHKRARADRRAHVGAAA